MDSGVMCKHALKCLKNEAEAECLVLCFARTFSQGVCVLENEHVENDEFASMLSLQDRPFEWVPMPNEEDEGCHVAQQC